MRRAELVRRIERVVAPAAPRADLEQVVTPAEAAAELLFTALAEGDLAARSVADLGSGTGRLALGAAWLGAYPVVGVEVDPELVDPARRAAAEGTAGVEFVTSDVSDWNGTADTVVMNPPFGAQRRHADRPFWDAAFRTARRSIYAFALSNSRTFIARRAVAANARVLETRPIAWVFPRTFRHHTRRNMTLPVDLWVVRTERNP
jgi:putative methylase